MECSVARSFREQMLATNVIRVVSDRLFRAMLNLVVRPMVPTTLLLLPVRLTILVLDDRVRSRKDVKLAAFSGRPMELISALFEDLIMVDVLRRTVPLKVQLVERKN